MDVAALAEGLGLGQVLDSVKVAGGLSNDLWRVRTERGVFALKVMVINADQPDFVTNLERSFDVERRAFAAGVPMPRPITVPGHRDRCLLAHGGSLARAHHWVDAAPVDPQQHAARAGALLAQIHRSSNVRSQPLDDEPWSASEWCALADQCEADPTLQASIRSAAPDLAELEAVTADSPGDVIVLDSHRDLDPKNALVTPSGLLALDWDAAGPVPAAREAVQVALDWTTDVAGFAQVVAAYRAASPHPVPDAPWVFGGWVSALGGWLVYNASRRADTELGVREARTTLARLEHLHGALPQYVAALGASGVRAPGEPVPTTAPSSATGIPRAMPPRRGRA